MIKRALPAAGRVLSENPRFFSRADGIEDRPRLGDHASLYVHWPYCLRRCTYCNFNKYTSRGSNEATMAECLQREAETLLTLSQVSRVTSVFFGGGTPSLARPSTLAALLETVSRRASLAADAEVTLEVNPTPAGRSRLEDYRRAGVNRFSIGVQDDDLKLLGRDHTSLQALQTLEEARRVCPGRVSVDAMFGRPGQSVESWEEELSELLRACDDHVSLYQLTPERGTQLFAQVGRGEVTLPSEDATAEMYQRARDVLRRRGFLQYEVSNFARNNAVSHHNLNYWRGGQYIGIGPGAHGRFVPAGQGGVLREARTQTLEPDAWMWEVQRRGHGTRRRIKLDHADQLEEALVMGLRMTEGISHKRWALLSPQLGLRDVFGASVDVRDFLKSGRLILDHRGLRCSDEGLALLDSMLPALLVELEGRVRGSGNAGGRTEPAVPPHRRRQS